MSLTGDLKTNPLRKQSSLPVVSIPLIGRAMLLEGLITDDQLAKVLAVHSEKKLRMGEAAVSLGFITDIDLARFLAKFFHIPFFDLSEDSNLDISAIEMIPEAMARRCGVIIAAKDGNTVTLVMSDPTDVRVLDAVRVATKCTVRKAVGPREAILQAIDHYYHTPARLARSINKLVADETSIAMDSVTSGIAGGTDLLDRLKLEASDVPVIQYVNLMLMQAVQERASDIHVEPDEADVVVRFRIDGQLREMSAPPRHMLQAITTRIKLLSNLDIAERRLPQDGRFKFGVFDKEIDVRASCIPTIYGEKIVLRILDRASLILELEALGFEKKMRSNFEKVLHLPHGLIILTGPTGSGKTTTLYAALNSIRNVTKNIVTIEDPVEYRLARINQIHAKPDIGLTFAAGLRSILRQDPDIIMVGEIRDRETAEICIRAALTGHLVLSTLHTNDAVSAVSRLMDMGVEPYLLSATLNLVMAQRLVRRVCEDCAAVWEPPADVVAKLTSLVRQPPSEWKLRKGRGCAKCVQTGYKGRVAVYEQFLISDEVRHLISSGAALSEIKAVVHKEGQQSLFESALNKTITGVTTIDEAFSICVSHTNGNGL